ncbi:MAG TPA: 4-alpha-glucanotransferase, partial [Clostridiales bacterium]|nr:4-alpha-glucanotransferase [Clostridiales bacterium]
MPVFSLWGEYGCGDFGPSAREFVDFLEAGGFSWWQVLPFCMTDR